MKRWLTGVILVTGVTMAAGPLLAHHGTGISYNLTAPLVTIKGTVTEFAWRNPHVSIFIDVKDGKGTVVNWGLEHNNVNSLARLGYNRNTLRPSQEVTAVFHPSRSAAPVGLVVKIGMTMWDQKYYKEPWVSDLKTFKQIPREDVTYFGWYGLFGGITDAICAPMNETDDFNKRIRDPAGLGVQGRP